MTDKQLERANSIHKEIKKIESFLFTAEKVWTGKLIKETSRYIIKSNGYGALNSTEYELDTVLKNKMLDVLRNELSELKKELSTL